MTADNLRPLKVALAEGSVPSDPAFEALATPTVFPP